jgi:dynein assembly factor with WDR repeat domains 1
MLQDPFDRTCKIWDINKGKCVETLRGHIDKVLDLCFNSTGTRLVTASADSTARVYNVHTGACIAI